MVEAGRGCKGQHSTGVLFAMVSSMVLGHAMTR